MMAVGVLCSRVRVEEKLLFEAFEALGVAVPPSTSLCSMTASAASRSLTRASSRPHEPTGGFSTAG